MHIQAQRPIFVPAQFRAEIEKLSKAALMDMVWDYATRSVGDEAAGHDPVMAEFRETREIILGYRKRAKQQRVA